MAESCSTSTAGVDSDVSDDASEDLCDASVSNEVASSTSDSQQPKAVRSFLDTLKQARPSELSRKRAIRHSHSLKKKKPSCSTDPKGVTPGQRVLEFPDEHFTKSAGKLFCNACREELSLKSSIIKNHIESSKHKLGKESLRKREARERDIVQALQSYDDREHPTGQTLPDSQRVFRVQVVCAFLRAGVSLNKLCHFRDILECNSYKLADLRGMYDLIPFVVDNEQKQIKQEVQGKRISVIFDGTTRRGEAMAIIVRFMDNWSIKQRLVRLQMLVKTMTGEEIAR